MAWSLEVFAPGFVDQCEELGELLDALHRQTYFIRADSQSCTW